MDREQAIEKLTAEKEYEEGCRKDDTIADEDLIEALDIAIEALEQEPTGHWIIKDNMFWVCSECGCQTRMMKKYNTPNYCPACGVRIVEPQEGADD